MEKVKKGLGDRFTLREGLWLGFCATFIVIARAALRFKLNIPGHSQFFTMFFMLLGRAVVKKNGAAAFIGLVAGVLSLMLGMGRGGPLVIVRYMISGLAVDLAFGIHPRIAESYLWCALVGGLAAGIRVVVLVAVEILAGMDTVLMVQHAALASVMNIAFGALGSLMVPPVVRRLKASGFVS